MRIRNFGHYYLPKVFFMITALLIVLAILSGGGFIMYLLAKFVERIKEKEKGKNV